MAHGVLVFTGTWRLSTKQGWALGNVTEDPTPARNYLAIVMTSGQRIRKFEGVNWE